MVRDMLAEPRSGSSKGRARRPRTLVILIAVAGVLMAQSVVWSARAASGPCQPPRCVQGSVTVGDEHIPFNVVLPVDYATSARHYPVVYLLHGGLAGQNQWLGDGIEAFTGNLPPSQEAIVVLPSSAFGIWLDWQNGNHLDETALLHLLVPYIDAQYRTIPDRDHRAIAGLSAGGFGSLQDAAHRPDLFAAVGSFSGLDDVTDPVVEAALVSLGPAVSALCTVQPSNSVTRCANNTGTQDVLPPSAAGNPLTDQLWFHAHNPGDLAVNYRGMSVWLSSGNGTPCDSNTVTGDPQGTVAGGILEAGLIRRTHLELDSDLTAAGIPHTDVYWGCGDGHVPYLQQDLTQWWQVMINAMGRTSPRAFDYRSSDATFSVWGWDFAADPGRAREFLTAQGASAAGVGLTGSGLTTITTAPLFVPRTVVSLRGATASSATADPNGRITFQVDLGPPHTLQEYTAQATAAEAIANTTSTGYFVSRAVQFSGTT